MIPAYLSIENFMCHEKSEISFKDFQNALIIGKIENNDMYSNGVGKSTIFRAIEYVLFGQSDSSLDKIIRDDQDFCKVSFDFIINDQEYRVVRKRSSKGATEISLFKKNADVWKDISGRRSSDTNSELEKILKINHKIFRSIAYFVQKDLTGLSTMPVEKRKAALKEVLSIGYYSKLEKIAKDKYNAYLSEISKVSAVIDSITVRKEDIDTINASIAELDRKLALLNKDLDEKSNALSLLESDHSKINKDLSSYEESIRNKTSQKASISKERDRLQATLSDLTAKAAAAKKYGVNLVESLKEIDKQVEELNKIDFAKAEILKEQANSYLEIISKEKYKIQVNSNLRKELSIPLPKEAFCKTCRQALSDNHRQNCENDLKSNLSKCIEEISASEEIIKNSDVSLNSANLAIKKLLSEKANLENLLKTKEIKLVELKQKKESYKEISKNVEDTKVSLEEKSKDLAIITEELESLVTKEVISLREALSQSNKLILERKNDIKISQENINKLKTDKKVLEFKTKEIEETLLKKADLLKRNEELVKNSRIYPKVIQAFSSGGIPNIIIQNVLDDLQIAANKILDQIKPGLQLTFIVSKENSEGNAADTLDIQYFFNGRERDYECISGAMKLAIAFSLKIGLAFVLQNLLDINIQFLLLDEVDESLDRAGADAFVDIIKFLSDKFKILVVTHNDRLKDKFNNIIVVEQNSSGVSKIFQS